jgi:hypothetical protein
MLRPRTLCFENHRCAYGGPNGIRHILVRAGVTIPPAPTPGGVKAPKNPSY